jgi:hypothetical protein
MADSSALTPHRWPLGSSSGARQEMRPQPAQAINRRPRRTGEDHRSHEPASVHVAADRCTPRTTGVRTPFGRLRASAGAGRGVPAQGCGVGSRCATFAELRQARGTSGLADNATRVFAGEWVRQAAPSASRWRPGGYCSLIASDTPNRGRVCEQSRGGLCHHPQPKPHLTPMPQNRAKPRGRTDPWGLGLRPMRHGVNQRSRP